MIKTHATFVTAISAFSAIWVGLYQINPIGDLQFWYITYGTANIYIVLSWLIELQRIEQRDFRSQDAKVNAITGQLRGFDFKFRGLSISNAHHQVLPFCFALIGVLSFIYGLRLCIIELMALL